MTSRRHFIKETGLFALGAVAAPSILRASSGSKLTSIGLQLYTVRDQMMEDAIGTLKRVAKIGFKELESSGSDKGSYFGLSPKEFRKVVTDLGMNVRSGHVHINDQWQKTVEAAAEAGQSYLVCSSLPSEGQTIENYQKNADIFNKAGEDSKKMNITLGYHNHEVEFEKVDGQILYDILLDRTDPEKVIMQMDLGWVVMAGHDPIKYFDKYPGRFPLWHLKDMDKVKMHSTEFGKGQVDIPGLLSQKKKSGMKYFFVEQEEYSNNAWESVKYDYDYLVKLK